MTYFLIIIGIISFPLLISLTPKFRFYLNYDLLQTLVATATPFLIWDWWATTQGHWSFSKLHTLGIQIAHLPVEEIAFFFVAPFACLLFYAGANRYLTQKNIVLSHIFWIIAIGASLFLFLSGIGKPYSLLVSILSIIALVISWKLSQSQLSYATILFFGLGFFFFFLFNTLLTGIPVVSYAPWAITGMRIGTIPIEDFWYNFLLLWLTLITYLYLMKKQSSAQQVFRAGSSTYYTASRFFSSDIREKVTKLYAFVRVADDYIDQLPEKSQEFQSFVTEYRLELEHPGKARPVIANFVMLMHETSISPQWVDAFLNSMIQDTKKKTYATLSELEEYIFGSADVIGLMMARIFKMGPEHDPAARQLGKAMQYCNMLRDIDEDLQLGRIYIPQSIVQKYGLSPLSKTMVQKRPKQFRLMMQQEISRCLEWFDQAEKGLSAIPRKERIAVKTATAMYRWTAEQLYRNPQLVFQKKLKPSKMRVILMAMYFSITS